MRGNVPTTGREVRRRDGSHPSGHTRPVSVQGAQLRVEAALADAPEAVCDKARGDAVLRGLWESPPQSGALLRFLGLCAASGLFAVLCAFAKGALGFGLLAVAVGAPVVEETAKVVLPLIPMGKLIRPEDIADTILFLASEKAGMLTGQVIKVSGGHAL